MTFTPEPYFILLGYSFAVFSVITVVYFEYATVFQTGFEETDSILYWLKDRPYCLYLILCYGITGLLLLSALISDVLILLNSTPGDVNNVIAFLLLANPGIYLTLMVLIIKITNEKSLTQKNEEKKFAVVHTFND
jgi:hypothetical protein